MLYSSSGLGAICAVEGEGYSSSATECDGKYRYILLMDQGVISIKHKGMQITHFHFVLWQATRVSHAVSNLVAFKGAQLMLSIVFGSQPF